MDKKEHIYSLSELNEVVADLLPLLLAHKVVCLSGEMGAGKTTFVAALANVLHLTDPVSSPTFAIINEYKSSRYVDPVYHLDLYRIASEEELWDVGLEELIESPFTLMLIEWPQIAHSFLPSSTVQLQIEKVSQNTRKLTVSG